MTVTAGRGRAALLLALLSMSMTGCCLQPVSQLTGEGPSSLDGGDGGIALCLCANPQAGFGWCSVPTDGCCAGAAPCEGWCLDSNSYPAPCVGFCLVDGGLYSPAVPCEGGCGWLGASCTPGSNTGCCAGLTCGGGTGACCAPDGLSCLPQDPRATGPGSTCCSGHCVQGTCLACVPNNLGPCITGPDCCSGVCLNGGCGCVGSSGACTVDVNCCTGSCVDGGCT
jgi:hypothetical protein